MTTVTSTAASAGPRYLRSTASRRVLSGLARCSISWQACPDMTRPGAASPSQRCGQPGPAEACGKGRPARLRHGYPKGHNQLVAAAVGKDRDQKWPPTRAPTRAGLPVRTRLLDRLGGPPALSSGLRRPVIHGAGAVMVDRRAALRSLLRVERALDTVNGIAHRVHGPASPLDGLRGHRPFDRTAGMGRPTHAARDQKP